MNRRSFMALLGMGLPAVALAKPKKVTQVFNLTGKAWSTKLHNAQSSEHKGMIGEFILSDGSVSIYQFGSTDYLLKKETEYGLMSVICPKDLCYSTFMSLREKGRGSS